LLVATTANSQSEYILSRSVSTHATQTTSSSSSSAPSSSASPSRDAQRAVIAKSYARFYSTVNLFGLLIQAFLVSRIFKRLGVQGALFIAPALALACYALMAAVPVFPFVIAGKLFENSTDYSLHNTVRHALFLPTSREAKYKAKAAIDSFFLRLGDVLAAGMV